MRRPTRAERERRSLEATAYHEAGHAVASLALGRGVRRVSIVPDLAAGTLGLATNHGLPSFRPDVRDDAPTQAKAEREILILLAGPAAEERFTGRRNRAGAAGDHAAAAAALALSLCGDEDEASAFLAWLVIRGRNLIAAPGQWIRVAALARALVDRRELSGAEVRRVCVEAMANAVAAHVAGEREQPGD